MKISIVIPCYNEEEGIPQLVEKLYPLVESLQQSHTVEVIFVDDGSTDKTNELLHRYFENQDFAKIVTHPVNKNLGAALKTGFSHATGDVVAALDSDCTYEPQLLFSLLNALDDNTDIVTVSPYHPHGKVMNVPGYRLFLSKSVSTIYSLLLGSSLHTYTAMVRVYKRDVIDNVTFKSNTFLGVTELLVKSLLQGYRAKEIPTTLHVRKFGVSKMKTLSVIKDHLGLISRIVQHKVLRRNI